MDSRHTLDSKGGIQLTVTPKSSAFFSGETLEFAITFRNTRPRQQQQQQHHHHYSSHGPLAHSPAHSLSASTSKQPYRQHAKHLSTSALHHSSGASSAPATRSAFSSQQYSQPNYGLSSTASPSRSYTDLSAFASPDNRSGTSTHIVLPERKGVIGTPLALASTSAPNTPSTSPAHHLRRPVSHNQAIPNSASGVGGSLYPNKRLPNAGHRKNDYSVAGLQDESILRREYPSPPGEASDGLSGVSDLSSQLAGMAILQQREGSFMNSHDEDAVMNAHPFVEQYKRQGDILQSRYPSINTDGSWRSTSGFSTITEDAGPDNPPPTIKRFPPEPRRSLSYNSAFSNDTSRTRIPSNSSIASFEQLDQSNDYHDSSHSTFYGIGRNESVDSVLRNTVTEFTRPSTLPRQSPSSASSGIPPQGSRHISANHGRSYSAAVGVPRPESAPPTHLLSPNIALSEGSSSSSFSNDDMAGTETLLWAFAQFNGSFTVEEALVKTGEFNAVKKSLFGGGSTPGTDYAIGGGSLDTSAASDANAKSGTVSGKLASWLWGTNSSSSTSASLNKKEALLHPSGEFAHPNGSMPTDPVLDPASRRRSSAIPLGVQTSYNSSAHAIGSLEERRNRAMNDKNYPVFSSPPSILAVDLTLEPGESKTYNFSLPLPGDLPPSFRGKAINFNYTLMVGTNRAPNQSMGEFKQHSRLIRIPVRIYNHVSVTGVRPFYDLTNPIIWSVDEAKVISDEDEGDENIQSTGGMYDRSSMKSSSSPSRVPSSSLSKNTRTKRNRQRSSSLENAYSAARKSEQRKDFLNYATKLLDASNAVSDSPRRGPSLPPPIDKENDGKGYLDDGGPDARPELKKRTSSSSSYAVLNGNLLGQDGEDTSCKSAVEIVSRNAQKISYDINKDGYRIAVLTLVKSAYRLGDTVNVMISMNEGAARVLRLAARLETHELIETTVSIKPASQVRQLTRRLHAEHHETTLDSGRCGFALAIPSGATPDFATSGVKLQWSLRVSLLILPPQIPRSIPGMAGVPRPGSSTPTTSPMALSSASSSSSSLMLPSPGHAKSRSLAFSGTSLPNTPVPVETGTHHLLPLPSIHPHQQYTSYRAVPDLSFIPTLFQSPEAQAASDALGLRGSTGEVNGDDASTQSRQPSETVVLMPTKIETVEVSIPLRVYPSATPFRPHVSMFVV